MPQNPEYESVEYQGYKEKDETGYSEKQLDIDAEIQAGEWQHLKRYRTYQRRSRQWKIIAMHKAKRIRVKIFTDFVIFYSASEVNATPHRNIGIIEIQYYIVTT